MNESNIEKEVELLKYRIENKKLLGENPISNLTLNDALSLHNLEYIEKYHKVLLNLLSIIFTFGRKTFIPN